MFPPKILFTVKVTQIPYRKNQVGNLTFDDQKRYQVHVIQDATGACLQLVPERSVCSRTRIFFAKGLISAEWVPSSVSSLLFVNWLVSFLEIWSKLLVFFPSARSYMSLVTRHPEVRRPTPVDAHSNTDRMFETSPPLPPWFVAVDTGFRLIHTAKKAGETKKRIRLSSSET